MSRPVLVIGYGNELRGDDGVGPSVARALAARRLAGVEVICCHQLLPELAERVAASRAVIFIDAVEVGQTFLSTEGIGRQECLPHGVAVRPLESATNESGVGHTSDPRALLALARALSGGRPEAWLVTVPASNLEFGEGLSPLAERGAAEAECQVLRLLTAADRD